MYMKKELVHGIFH